MIIDSTYKKLSKTLLKITLIRKQLNVSRLNHGVTIIIIGPYTYLLF